MPSNPSKSIYLRLQAYFDSVRNIEVIADGEDIFVNGQRVVVNRRTIAVMDPVNRFHVYELTLNDSVRATNANGIPPLVEVKAGIGKLMDWSPRLVLRAPSQWSFLPSDVATLCVLTPTCVMP